MVIYPHYNSFSNSESNVAIAIQGMFACSGGGGTVRLALHFTQLWLRNHTMYRLQECDGYLTTQVHAPDI
jgi:hypothetical protein